MPVIPPPTQILVDIFTQLRNAGDGSPELDSLTTYMAFMRNATMNTVNRLLSLLKSNNDSLLLTLGSLAEYAPKEVSGCNFTFANSTSI